MLHQADAEERGGHSLGPLVAEAVSAIKQQRQLQVTHRLQWGKQYSDHDLIFAQEDGSPLNPSAVTHRFTALVASLRDPDDPTFR
jgi:hypothetical protein